MGDARTAELEAALKRLLNSLPEHWHDDAVDEAWQVLDDNDDPDEDDDGPAPLGEVQMAFDVTCYAVIDLDAREVTSVHVMDEECRNPRLADPDDRGIVDLAHEIFDNAEWPGWEFGW